MVNLTTFGVAALLAQQPTCSLDKLPVNPLQCRAAKPELSIKVAKATAASSKAKGDGNDNTAKPPNAAAAAAEARKRREGEVAAIRSRIKNIVDLEVCENYGRYIGYICFQRRQNT